MSKFFFRLALSLAIGAGLLYLASNQIDFSKTWSSLINTEWWVLVPYFAAMFLQHFFRAWRWGYLLAPIQHVPFNRILPIASVGFLAIIALPLRMGELVRPYLIMDPPKLRMSHGFGTMAVERVFDGLFLALSTFITIAIARTTTEVPSWLFGSGLIALCIFFTALVVLIMALWKKDRAVSLCRRMFSLFSPRIGDRLAHIAEGIVDGFKVLPNFSRLTAFIFATLAYWFINGVAIWILSWGFGLELHLGQAIGVMVIVGIGIMIPAGPGFIGSFELFAMGAIGLYVPQEQIQSQGAAFILTFHATNALYYAVTGFIAMMSPQVSFTKVWKASTQSSKNLDQKKESTDQRDENSHSETHHKHLHKEEESRATNRHVSSRF